MSPATPAEIAAMESRELRKLERQIALRHANKFPYLEVIWAFANLAFWLALWPLVLLDIMPLWLGFIAATISLSLVYLPTHDAQHDIIARPGQPLRWLNELVGHATSWMIVLPFNVLRVTHLEHHKHTNDPKLDPDISSKSAGPWGAIWAAVRNRQPDGKRNTEYLDSLQRNGRQDLIPIAIFFKLGFYAILIALAWSGFALEAFFLWWLPYHIAMTYLVFFLSWAPHHPADNQEKYGNTRSWKSRVGNIGSMGMQFHIVHHLHPYIPLSRTPAAYREMRPILEARDCDLGEN